MEHVLASDAVRLFVDRARAANPGFSVAHRDSPALAAVCRRLDGPLLASTCCTADEDTTLRAPLERLDRPLELLVAPTRHGPERHRACAHDRMENAALTPPERQLLQALSIFALGAPLDAVEAVASLRPAGAAWTRRASR